MCLLDTQFLGFVSVCVFNYAMYLTILFMILVMVA